MANVLAVGELKGVSETDLLFAAGILAAPGMFSEGYYVQKIRAGYPVLSRRFEMAIGSVVPADDVGTSVDVAARLGYIMGFAILDRAFASRKMVIPDAKPLGKLLKDDADLKVEFNGRDTDWQEQRLAVDSLSEATRYLIEHVRDEEVQTVSGLATIEAWIAIDRSQAFLVRSVQEALELEQFCAAKVL